MKNLVNLVAITTMATIARGRSIWCFEVPVSFNRFMLNLYWACVYDDISSQGIHASKRSVNSFEIWEEDFNCETEIVFKSNLIRFRTFWSGYEYLIMPSQSEGIRIEFRGPRKAFGTQTLVPKQISSLLDWKYCVGLYDANNTWFTFGEVLDFYRKVEKGNFFWDFLRLQKEPQPTMSTNKSARHSGEGSFNEPKWDHHYCSHRAKGTTLKTHRGGKKFIDGYFHKECPLWMIKDYNK